MVETAMGKSAVLTVRHSLLDFSVWMFVFVFERNATCQLLASNSRDTLIIFSFLPKSVLWVKTPELMAWGKRKQNPLNIVHI